MHECGSRAHPVSTHASPARTGSPPWCGGWRSCVRAGSPSSSSSETPPPTACSQNGSSSVGTEVRKGGSGNQIWCVNHKKSLHFISQSLEFFRKQEYFMKLLIYELLTCNQEDMKPNPKDNLRVTQGPDGFFVVVWLYSSNLMLFNETGSGYVSSVCVPITRTGSSSATHQSTSAKLACKMLCLYIRVAETHEFIFKDEIYH